MSIPGSKREPIGIGTGMQAFSIGALYSTNCHLGVGGGGVCAVGKATWLALVGAVADAWSAVGWVILDQETLLHSSGGGLIL